MHSQFVLCCVSRASNARWVEEYCIGAIVKILYKERERRIVRCRRAVQNSTGHVHETLRRVLSDVGHVRYRCLPGITVTLWSFIDVTPYHLAMLPEVWSDLLSWIRAMSYGGLYEQQEQRT